MGFFTRKIKVSGDDIAEIFISEIVTNDDLCHCLFNQFPHFGD